MLLNNIGITEYSAWLQYIYHAVGVVQHRVCVNGSIVKVLSPRIAITACAAIEQIGYFAACKLFGCSRSTTIVYWATACQVVAVGFGAFITANAANIFRRTRNRSCVVAVGYYCSAVIVTVTLTANTADIVRTRNRSCVVAIGLCSTITANAANIFSRTQNRSCVVAVDLCSTAAANAADISKTKDIRINNPNILYRRSIGTAYQTHIVAVIGVIIIQAANGVAVAVEFAIEFRDIESSNRCPTVSWCTVESAFGSKHVFVYYNVGCKYTFNIVVAAVNHCGKLVKVFGRGDCIVVFKRLPVFGGEAVIGVVARSNFVERCRRRAAVGGRPRSQCATEQHQRCQEKLSKISHNLKI